MFDWESKHSKGRRGQVVKKRNSESLWDVKLLRDKYVQAQTGQQVFDKSDSRAEEKLAAIQRITE